jgi:DNA-directed RNA polymerase specialized sigma subunit
MQNRVLFINPKVEWEAAQKEKMLNALSYIQGKPLSPEDRELPLEVVERLYAPIEEIANTLGSEKQRLVLALMWSEGLTAKEIGSVLAISESMVHKMRAAARKEILSRLNISA